MEDIEREVEKALDRDGDEEGQRLLQEYENFGLADITTSEFARRRRQHQKLFFVLCTALLALTALSFLSYRSVVPQRWKPSTSIGDSEESQDNEVLAIRLRPELHKDRAPQTIEHDWTVTSGIRAPDGIQKEVYLINSAFPGPTVEARSGDRLLFRVRNNLTDDEGLSIHWHGLFMRNANDMDGTLGFTQVAIPQGGSMTYEFDIANDQCGTFWYHAHSQLQRADGLYGGLVVHCPADVESHIAKDVIVDEDEQLLLIGDWYHRPAGEVLEWYHHWRSFGNEPVPDSLVVNGGGSYNCSKAAPSRPVVCNETEAAPMLSFRQGPTRLRVVNVGSLTGLTLRTLGAVMRPFELDGGNPIEGTEAHSIGILYPGERVDLLIQPIRSRNLTTSITSPLELIMDPENFQYGNPALTPNQTFPMLYQPSSTSAFPSIPSSATSSIQPHFDLQTALSRSLPLSDSSTSPNRTFVIYASTPLLAHLENRPTGMLNHSSYTPSSSPSDLPLISTPRSSWPEGILVPQIKAGSWISLTINNLDDGGHPFHLHGHDFWVMRTWKSKVGFGSYNPFTGETQNSGKDGEEGLVEGLQWEERPRKKDTLFVPRKGHVMIKFQAQREEWGAVGSVWAMHCHVLWHAAVGMEMGWEVVEPGL